MLNLQDYQKHSVSCLNPQLVYNPHINEYVVTPCRQCTVCINKRSSLRAQQCSQEQASHKYCFFVTLTYDNLNVPKAEIRKTDNNTYHLVNTTPRLPDDVLLSIRAHKLGSVSMLSQKQTSTFNNYLNKNLNLNNNVILYASKIDLQKYIKRVRYHIHKQTGEFIRHFSCSEYGPKTFRPHFHCLFYFDKPETLQVFKRTCSKNWQYGHVHSELAKSTCGNYVSGYINSYVSIPSLLKTRNFAPFCTHSRFFGITPLQSCVDEIYANPLESTDKFNYSYPYGLVSILPTAQIKDYFFPKIYGYNKFNDSELSQLYGLYRNLSYLYYQVNECCHVKTSDLYSFLNTTDLLPIYKILDLSKGWEQSPRLVSRVYNVLNTSRHFFSFICKDDSNLFNIRLNSLKKFYQDSELRLLNTFYTTQETYSHSSPPEELDFTIFYPDLSSDNCNYDDLILKRFNDWKDKIRHHILYQEVKLAHYQHSYDKIKHKELNDSTGLLIASLNKTNF